MQRRRVDNPPADHVAARHAQALLASLGVDLDDPELAGTPARFAELLAELLSGSEARAPALSPIENVDRAAGMALARDLSFYALCAHHLLPFFGRAHVGYLPGARLAGMGDLARVVDHFSRRLTLQERIASEVADHLVSALAPRGVAVLLEGRHLCLEMRGQRRRAVMETSAFRGEMDKDPRRLEFVARVHPRGARKRPKSAR